MQPRRSTFASPLVITLALAVAACDSGPPAAPIAVYPVQGQVLFRGKPLAGALVTFYPAGDPKPGASDVRPTGQTDAEGRFRLMSFTSGDGAPAGSYGVGIAGMARPASEGSVLPDPTRPVTKTDVLKARYLDPKKSGITAEVKAGENVLPPFDLK